MKKLAFLLVLTMVLTLTACHTTPADKGDDDSATTTTTTTASPLLGSNDGETYENAYFGITCTITKNGWEMYDAEAMQARNLPILAFTADDDYATVVSNAKEFYDMCAVEDATGNSVAVRVENLKTLYDFLPTEQEFVDLQKTMLEGNPSLLLETPTVAVGDEEHPALKITWDEGAQIDTFVYIRVDDYMLIVEMTSTDGDHTAEWSSWFDTL